MKSHAIIVFSLVCLSFSGCSKRSDVATHSLPADSFRLSVSDVFADGDERVCSVTIESEQRPRVSLTEGSNSYGNWPAEEQSSEGRTYREWVASFAVSAVNPNGSDKHYVKTKIRSGSGVTVTEVHEVPAQEPLDKVMGVTIRDGVYKLGAPLVIGKYRGHDLNLVVRPEVIQTVAR
jgi:hypothetical protein